MAGADVDVVDHHRKLVTAVLVTQKPQEPNPHNPVRDAPFDFPDEWCISRKARILRAVKTLTNKCLNEDHLVAFH